MPNCGKKLYFLWKVYFLCCRVWKEKISHRPVDSYSRNLNDHDFKRNSFLPIKPRVGSVFATIFFRRLSGLTCSHKSVVLVPHLIPLNQ